MLQNEYLDATVAVHTAENEPCEVCPISVYRSPRYGVVAANYTVDTVRFPISPFESTSLEATELWSHTQTYFEYPHVQFFASNAELLRTLPQADLPLLSHRMRCCTCTYNTDQMQ